MRMRTWWVAAAAVLALGAGCSSSDDADDSKEPADRAGETVASSGEAPTASTPTAVEFNQELQDELVAMMRRDQGLDTEEAPDEGRDERQARLKEIIAEFGWPTYDLVGKKGEDAAWLIAQHADDDVAFQQEALELLRAAVEADQASPGNLAYLTDRVAVATGEPQTYGTQIGCFPKGPKPTTPIEDPGGVDARRAEAGLEPLDDYFDEMDKICSKNR